MEAATKTTAYAYLHGFASSASAKKGVHLRDALAPSGVRVLLPDLNLPSFERLSVRAMLSRLDALHEEEGRPSWRLIGSSLGGWLAARWAELHPERVDRLVLLCPAFDIPERWPHLLPAGAFERWRAAGELEMRDASGALRPMHFGFYTEAQGETAYPRVSCPVTVVHGRQDDRVPLSSTHRWMEQHPRARLIEVDDGHDLVASIPVIERVVRETFELG